MVLDTNVFVAAGFHPSSASARIVDDVRRGRLHMVWNGATRREIEHIMHRIPPLREYDLTDIFLPTQRFNGATEPALFAHVPDPDDRVFAGLAHAAGALLISSDEHLLGASDGVLLTVLTPGGFIARHPPSAPPA